MSLTRKVICFTASVHSADIQDRDGAPDLIGSACDSFPTLQHFYADGGYAGRKVELALFNMETSPTIEIVRRPDQAKGFVLVAQRWMVERTFAWLARGRRMSLIVFSEAVLRILCFFLIFAPQCYDEQKTLSYAIPPICPIGADVIQFQSTKPPPAKVGGINRNS